MGVNRINKRKHKKGCGCKLCKPHKGGWAPKFKPSDVARMKALEDEL